MPKALEIDNPVVEAGLPSYPISRLGTQLLLATPLPEAPQKTIGLISRIRPIGPIKRPWVPYVPYVL